MTSKPPLLVAVVVAAVATAIAATAVAAGPFRGSTGKAVRVSSSGDVAVAGAAGRRGSVRVRYVVPATWRRRSPLSARTLRFATGNSCRHGVRFTPHLVEGEASTAQARAAAFAPAEAAYVRASGTREGAAFRVVRTRGTSDLVGVLVQPLPARSTPGVAPGRQIFAELRARATADPRTECHSGGPRTVADAIGDAFGAGSVGGFVFRAGAG